MESYLHAKTGKWATLMLLVKIMKDVLEKIKLLKKILNYEY